MAEAIQVDGIWLPAGETHLVEHMAQNRCLVDGRGTYQYKKLEAALKILAPNRRRLAVDVGAHVGLWSMHLAKRFAQLQAFEPVPSLGDLWVRNVQSANAVLNRCALGNARGKVDMQIPIETTGNAHVAIAGAHPGTRGVAHPDQIELVRDVEMRTLDDCGLRNVDFIKIDVEGFERQVLLGGEKTIRRELPVIIVEQKGNDVAYGDKPRAALELLKKWGGEVKQEIGGDFVVEFCQPCAKIRRAVDGVIDAVRP